MLLGVDSPKPGEVSMVFLNGDSMNPPVAVPEPSFLRPKLIEMAMFVAHKAHQWGFPGELAQ